MELVLEGLEGLSRCVEMGEARGGDGVQNSILERKRPNGDINKGTCT